MDDRNNCSSSFNRRFDRLPALYHFHIMIHCLLMYSMMFLPPFPWMMRMLIPIVTISSRIFWIKETPHDSPAWQTIEIFDLTYPVDDLQSSAREECRLPCCIAISSQEEALEPVRSRPVQVRAYGVASTSSKMHVNGEEPTRRAEK